MEIGIDKTHYLIYEGHGSWGRAIWPAPVLFPAVITSSSSGHLVPAKDCWGIDSYIFREISFDPVSRVRRGFIYQANKNMQPHEWHVYPHPAMITENRLMDGNGVLKKSLHTFGCFSVKNALKDHANAAPLILLGTQKSFSIWNLLSFETDAAQRELLTLKSRGNIGVLPNIHYDRIHGDCKDLVREKINALLEDVYHAGAESVVDRCREAITAILIAYCQDNKIVVAGKDLYQLIKIMIQHEDDKKVVLNLADTVRIFHTRGKTVGKLAHQARRVSEHDAELAVQAVGAILCDLKLASW